MTKPNLLFWWRWLVAVTGITLIYGASFIVAPHIAMSIYHGLLYGTPDVAGYFGAQATPYITFIYGVLGAVLVGWMVTLLPILFGSFRRGERSAWQSLTYGIGVWFVVDSGYSLLAGFPANAVINTALFILFAIPLAATYRDFHTAYSSPM